MNNPYTRKMMAYDDAFSETWTPEEAFTALDMSLPDDKLSKMLIDDLDVNVNYWNQAPWALQDTDKTNVSFFLNGYEALDIRVNPEDLSGNHLFTATRAILSYATGQLAKPELTPSRSDDQYVKMARSMESALYLHTENEDGEVKVRSAVANLIIRKRGGLKQRFDPDAGLYGDTVTDVWSPDDVTIDRTASFMSDPNKIYHRLSCSIDELVSKFPDKKAEIYQAYDIQKGVFTQLSKTVTYYECWFTYIDTDGIAREGVSWFVANPTKLILDKMPNPNWIYTGDDLRDKMINVTPKPPKPFTFFNYLNLGKSFIDETCLFDQGVPLQKGLNNRSAQLNKNVDYQNGRWVASKDAFDQDDATKLVNKGAKTVAMTNAVDARTALAVVTSESLSPNVFESVEDFRNEINGVMGTPSIFQGGNPTSQDTLGRDQMVKAQAGMLQDDLVRAVQNGMSQYYLLKLQMMRVYYTDDYWFAQKGADGNFDFIMLNSDMVDPGVRINVQADSTLPVDKESVRAQATISAKLGMIDPLTYFIDIGVPDPEIRAERLNRYKIDLYTYMQSIEQSMDNNDAEVDIMLLTAGKQPSERDAYDQAYLDYFNHFLTMNRFAQLPQDAKTRLVSFLQNVAAKAQQSAELQESMLNDAGIINRPPIFPLPKRTLNMRINGNMDPQQTQQIVGGEGQMFTPVTQAQQAQDPAAAQSQPQQQQQ